MVIEATDIGFSGIELLEQPLLNKDTAFTEVVLNGPDSVT